MLSAEFAVNENTRIDRALKTHKTMNDIKQALQPLTNVLINTLGCAILPRCIFKQTIWDTYNRHSVVFGNVPGPPVRIICVLCDLIIVFCVVDEGSFLWNSC